MNVNLCFCYVIRNNVNQCVIVGKKALFLGKINKFAKKLNRKKRIEKYVFILKM